MDFLIAKKNYASVTVPPAPVRVLSRQTLDSSAMLVKSVRKEISPPRGYHYLDVNRTCKE